MKEMTTQALAEKINLGENLSIIDVREADEVAEGKIPGAHHIPLMQIPDHVHTLDKNEHYYLICRSGGRSGQAGEFLAAKGFNVTNVTGGMLAWEGETE